MDTQYGVGIGWRPEIAGYVAGLPGLRFTEVVAESVRPAAPPPALLELRARGVTVIPHGVKLSLGGAEPVDRKRVGPPRRVRRGVGRAAGQRAHRFCRAGGIEVGHLPPLPRTRDAVDVMVDNVRLARRTCRCRSRWNRSPRCSTGPTRSSPRASSSPRSWSAPTPCCCSTSRTSTPTPATGAQDPPALLDELPLERIAYVHVAGGEEHDGIYHDTHTDPIPPPVLDLVRELCSRHRPPALLLERDGRYPPAADLTAELDAIAAAAGVAPITVP